MDAEQKWAKELVKNFRKTGLGGSLEDKIRNLLGNKGWPLVSKFCGAGKWVSAGLAALSVMGGVPEIALPFLLTSGASHIAQLYPKGHTKFLQNIALKNASSFGRFMKENNIPESVRKKAMEQFLKKESPLFTAKQYISKNPDMVERLSNGLPVPKNKNFISIWDGNVEALARRYKGKGPIPFKERWKTYKKIFRDYKASKTPTPVTSPTVPNMQIPSAQASANIAPETKKTSLQTIIKDRQQTIAKATEQKPISKSLTPKAPKSTSFSNPRKAISPKLMSNISNRTLQRTGAQIATKATIKSALKKLPVISFFAGATFAAQRALSGDWTGAGWEFTSGVAGCVPGLGTATSVAIDAGLAIRDVRNSR